MWSSLGGIWKWLEEWITSLAHALVSQLLQYLTVIIMMNLKWKPDTHFLQIFSVSLEPQGRCYLIWPLILSPVSSLMTSHLCTSNKGVFHIFAYAVPVPWSVTVTSLQGFHFHQVTPIPPFSLSSLLPKWFPIAVLLWTGFRAPFLCFWTFLWTHFLAVICFSLISFLVPGPLCTWPSPAHST